MTVGDLRSRMSQREYVEWGAYYRIQAERRDRAEQRARNTAKTRRR